MPLEDHYVGDEAFARFTASPDPELDARIGTWSGWSELVAACQGDALLARALLRVIGEDALRWLDTRPPVLDGLSGRECLSSQAGLARLKEALIRFPWL